MATILLTEKTPLGLAAGAVDHLLREALRLLGADHEVSVTAVGEAEMAELNRSYRGLEGATDVLSFALNEGEGGGVGDYWLGDIVVCPAVAARHAHEAKRPVAEEVRWVLIHGLLHLLGYDHERDAAAARLMREKEQWLLHQITTA
ncbi:MAG: rRNA maturation RNase YbeY [Nitrospirae bacterium CG18_big_fil_WC_8_21_14_2_50_70_55]|nr:rRNA maturation RNase YbeY [Deltaproteobacteria bacterium]OIP61938.1 MAG: rRNA maturation RNase YbeY [Nitrospirae bacterium CG2_30_70_394]PIQ06932.1 MAG: rRNA maturation RNase YbeY [Nitrospirae bacterium CG18_big_fil_WC_8_21_14_2_50_70_55]PIU79170.1 MAG: rRNA maturation RNase YbeY [Nitrospirae bacterium CG06_land_8_20_14_3_00_70_43]PIW82100.1 MAG: rRNA maturation RNase YbeY [Nitrospirae bacterium CG_4_8_14_3_um_filter_70_85]PIX82832.1 MAG: rRNA maturation RNase YbeY [Nitrospirae bacterium C